jgi:hypothetical protein
MEVRILKQKTNYHIDPEHWDKDKQRPVRKVKDIQYANLDSDLAKLKMNLKKIRQRKSKGIEAINLHG